MKKLLLVAVFAASVAQINAQTPDLTSEINAVSGYIQNVIDAITSVQDKVTNNCAGTAETLQEIQEKITAAINAAKAAKGQTVAMVTATSKLKS